MVKDCIQVIKDRVSTRSYLSKEVPEDLLLEVVNAGHLAVSAGNLQPWEFYIVNNKSKIEKLARLSKQSWVLEAPTVIVACADPHISAMKYGEKGEKIYVVQDTAAAVENILLAAEAYGLASCWVGGFDEIKVKELLDIKDDLIAMAMITIGYPKGKIKESRPQRALEDILTIIN
ncbi:nitroreductase family protein [Orenia marismortui]|uniref:Nitroreductase n=1 Tax=Orenia marismortui TaxID=46469 RepID=A0A4R8H5Y4_9FIRM|nr:nitroreductase family protein [Orenia marismortui]TDX52760.1 nitroreductase [Orenia marismortui]